MGFCNLINKVSRRQLNPKIIGLRLGDTACFRITSFDGTKPRTQNCLGVLIARSQAGRNTNLTIRRFAKGLRVERNFNRDSAIIQDVRILRTRIVRRAKLYYLRTLQGKSAYLRENMLKLSTRRGYSKT